MEVTEKLATQMCKEIYQNSLEVEKYSKSAAINPKVLEVMREVPRHVFTSNSTIKESYVNTPQPIGCGQTISQPYIVALMTSLISPYATDKVLEIGTGTGYQAAVLSRLVDKVYTMEVIPELYLQAINNFAQVRFNNISCINESGEHGWPEFAPFDKIMVTAAAQSVPKTLTDQLKINGKMVIPLQDEFGQQGLFIINKNEDLSLDKKYILPVRFVPFQ